VIAGVLLASAIPGQHGSVAASRFGETNAAGLSVDGNAREFSDGGDRLHSPAGLGTVFTVTNANDDGPGSLRRAIEQANATPNHGAIPDRIVFDLPGDGVQSVRLYAALPAITESVTLDGHTQRGAAPPTLDRGGGTRVLVELDGSLAGIADGFVLTAGSTTIRGLAIRGFSGDGIRILGGAEHRIEGNVIGPAVVPDAAAGNGGHGISIVESSSNVVGGTEGSLRNWIAWNRGSGVWVSGERTKGNSVLGNRIVSNGRSGIELEHDNALAPDTLGPGPNRLRRSPVLDRVSRLEDGAVTGARIEGSLESAPNTRFRLEFYSTRARASASGEEWESLRTANSRKEGERLFQFADVTTDGGGGVRFLVIVPAGVESRALVTATATDAEGNTSEFSMPIQAPAITRVWNNAAGGNWSVATNWTPDGVPGIGDDAQITLNGTYTVTLDANAELGSLTLGGASGVPTLSIGASTLTLDGASTVNLNGALSQSGGAINGPGALTVDGAYNWFGGAMSGVGTTTVNGTLTIGGGSVKSVNGRTLNTSGTTNWIQATFSMQVGNGGVINNSGVWDCQTDRAMTNLGGTAAFNNAGTFKKSGASGQSAIGIPFNNSGSVQALAGILQFTAGYTQAAGATTVNGGVIASTTTMNIDGGIVSGSGTITANITSSGTMAPGLSAAVLHETGSYTQLPGGSLSIELGGPAVGTQYDQLNLTGTGIANLSGTLDVSLINGFVPVSGDSFTVMTYASRTGELALNLPQAGCSGWLASYGPTALVLTEVDVPAELTGLRLLADKTAIVWDAAPPYPATAYDVLRGAIHTLPVRPGTGEFCLASGISATATSDSDVPIAGQGFWYVVRERVAACGTGTYGFASDGTERTSTGCP